MLFDGRSLNDLSLDDFRVLVEEHIAEGSHLDYKQVAYGHNDRIEMLRDISALANAEGGYLVLGIAEGIGNKAERFTPIDNPEQVAQTMRQLCLDGISERIEGFEVRAYEIAFNQGIVVIRIPPSRYAPHMITLNQRTDFYRRYGTDKRAMTIGELRAAILFNPIFRRMVEALPDGDSAILVDEGQSETSSQATIEVVSEIGDEAAKDIVGPPPVLLYTERSVERFLQRYLMGGMIAQVLVIVSPYIGDLAGSAYNLKAVINKAKADHTRIYVVTQPPVEKYHLAGIELLGKYPNIEIRYNPDVHAKLYICWGREEAESFALFGSGNLTQSGLKHNIELGMMVLSRGYGRKLVRELYQWASSTLRTTSKRVKRITV
jgi:hypothetical protein